MEPVLSVDEMQKVDASATKSIDALMDAAGYAVALSGVAMGIGYGSVVHVLAGRGNNGGDGYVASRYLRSRGCSVTVHHNGTPDPDSAAARAMESAQSSGVRVQPIGSAFPGDLLIDALYGTGFRGILPSVVVPWLGSPMPVLSVDIPSGVSGDTGIAAGAAFSAQRTATFHALKTGHLLGDGPDRCGVIDVYDIGLSGGEPSMWRFTDADVMVPRRERTTHKWSAGAVATVGGTPGLTGAAALCARASLACGAGVSMILTTEGTAPIYETVAPDIIAVNACAQSVWSDDASRVLASVAKYQTLVVGPGLEPASRSFVEHLIRDFAGVVILDAGALNALESPDVIGLRNGKTMLTPHAGEFRRLTGTEPSPDSVKDLATHTNSVVVAKGNPTIVAGDRSIVVDAGGPELATIGTGDVLCGMIAGLVASGIPSIEAAASAAYMHALAARALAVRETVTASALLAHIGSTVATFSSDAPSVGSA